MIIHGHNSIQSTTFNYSDQTQPLFDHVTLQFDASWKLALIGRNGRKTTLQNYSTPTTFDGQLVTNLDFQYFTDCYRTYELTRDILMQLGNRQSTWQVERELRLPSRTQIVWQPFASLSPGEQTKMLLPYYSSMTIIFN